MKHKQLSLATKSAWTAQIFILPFYLGFWFFFFSPLVESLRMCFSDVAIDMEKGYSLTYIGFDNFQEAIFEDTHYVTNLIASTTNLFWKVPAILILSLIVLPPGYFLLAIYHIQYYNKMENKTKLL